MRHADDLPVSRFPDADQVRPGALIAALRDVGRVIELALPAADFPVQTGLGQPVHGEQKLPHPFDIVRDAERA